MISWLLQGKCTIRIQGCTALYHYSSGSEDLTILIAVQKLTIFTTQSQLIAFRSFRPHAIQPRLGTLRYHREWYLLSSNLETLDITSDFWWCLKCYASYIPSQRGGVAHLENIYSYPLRKCEWDHLSQFESVGLGLGLVYSWDVRPSYCPNRYSENKVTEVGNSAVKDRNGLFSVNGVLTEKLLN